MLGLVDSKALGILKINKKGESKDAIGIETVNSLQVQQKNKVMVSGDKQELIYQRMEKIVAKYPRFIKGVERV